MYVLYFFLELILTLTPASLEAMSADIRSKLEAMVALRPPLCEFSDELEVLWELGGEPLEAEDSRRSLKGEEISN